MGPPYRQLYFEARGFEFIGLTFLAGDLAGAGWRGARLWIAPG